MEMQPRKHETQKECQQLESKPETARLILQGISKADLILVSILELFF